MSVQDADDVAPFRSDVNVGGPDGDPPYCTVGTVILPYCGSLSRRWLWDRLDEVRKEFLARYPERSDGPAVPSEEHKAL